MNSSKELSAENSNVNSDTDSDTSQESEEYEELPITNQITLPGNGTPGHTKPVTAIALDHSGNRLVTGSRDDTVKFWDFNTMDKRLRYIKSFEPAEGNPIVDLHFGSSGNQILVATPELSVRIYDRNGELKGTFAKGDPYVRDARRTCGHTANITLARWHPTDKSLFFTAGFDSTIRIWSLADTRQQKFVIPVKSKSMGSRTPITAAAMTLDGRIIVGGGEDGILRLWSSTGPFVMPQLTLENAHTPGSTITSAQFTRTNQLITRGMDDTLKLFDIRQFKKPLIEVFDVPNRFECTNTIISPDEKYILTGHSTKKGETIGKFAFYDSKTLELFKEVSVGTTSVCHLNWHSRINQIFCGMADGNIQILYNPMSSIGGIKDAIEREPKKRAVDDIDYYNGPVEIEAPEEEPEYPEERDIQRAEYMKKKMESVQIDPRDLRKPQMPDKGDSVGTNGVIGKSVTAYMMKTIIQDRSFNEDPREAILKYAEEAEKNPYWIDPAYQKNEPVRKYADAVYEDEDEALREAKKKRRQ